jgi:hypothetical protein
MQVFFRVKHAEHTIYRPEEHGRTPESRRAAAMLSDPWMEWEGLRRRAEQPRL